LIVWGAVHRAANDAIRWYSIVFVAVTLSLAGCALLPTSKTSGAFPEDLPPRVELIDVPFFPQEANQCGPAALATAMGYVGVARTPQELTDEVYLPQRQGSLQAEMLAATRRAGLIAYRLSPNFAAVLAEISGGHPVVVLQNQLFEFYPRWHYAVVVGYDRVSGELVLRSGKQMRLVDTQRAFERSWDKADRWAFVALSPGQLPATAQEDKYVLAAAALERVSPQAASTAYALALVNWPHNLAARIGLGNIAYGAHDLVEAQTQYRLATEEHADSADAWNNLAQVLHELGQDAQALAAVQRAIAIGGARSEFYRATLRGIGSASSH